MRRVSVCWVLALTLVLPNILLLLPRADENENETHNSNTNLPIINVKARNNIAQGNNTPKGLAGAMDEVVLLLSPRAEEYIRENSDFRFYVYELPSNFTWQYFAACLEETSNDCDWGSSICTQTRGSTSKFSSRRFNRNGDLVLSKIFSEYSGSMRTWDPTRADVFIVPYAATAHCSCKNKGAFCKEVTDHDIKVGVLDHLTYLNASTWSRHVFFNSVSRDHTHKFMHGLPLVVSLEANERLCKLGDNCGHIIQPYVNTNADYQPNHPQFIHTHRFNSLDQRHYAVAAVMHGFIHKDRHHLLRQELLKVLNDLIQKNQTIGGRPVYFQKIARRQLQAEAEVLSVYRNSIFCPCLRGDTPSQKRFFDVLMSGCIPVVLEFEPSHEAGYISYFRENDTSIRLTYPLSKGIFYDEPSMGIDYQRLVVAVNGTCGVPCILPTLEDLLVNHPEQVLAMQRRIALVASLFTHGMEKNSLQYPDTIAALLVQIRHFHIHNNRKG